MYIVTRTHMHVHVCQLYTCTDSCLHMLMSMYKKGNYTDMYMYATNHEKPSTVFHGKYNHVQTTYLVASLKDRCTDTPHVTVQLVAKADKSQQRKELSTTCLYCRKTHMCMWGVILCAYTCTNLFSRSPVSLHTDSSWKQSP